MHAGSRLSKGREGSPARVSMPPSPSSVKVMLSEAGDFIDNFVREEVINDFGRVPGPFSRTADRKVQVQ